VGEDGKKNRKTETEYIPSKSKINNSREIPPMAISTLNQN
jgi:hypothetical protein